MPECIDRLRCELTKQAVPKHYVNSIVEDVRCHFKNVRDACLEEGMDLRTSEEIASQRIGDPANVALAAAVNWRADHRWARRPWLTALCGPLFLVPVLQVSASFAPLAALGWGRDYDAAKIHCLAAFWVTCAVTLFTSFGVMKCVSTHVGQPKWLVRSAVAMAVGAMLWQVGVTLPLNGPGTGSLFVAIGAGLQPFQLLQACISLSPLPFFMMKLVKVHNSEPEPELQGH